MALQATHLQLKTYADLQVIPEDGIRYELIFGEIFTSPSPRTAHQLVLAALTSRVTRFCEESERGQVLFAPLDVRFSVYNVVQPDLFFVSRERLGILKPDYVAGAPDLIVEVLSPSNRRHDLVSKATLYAESGVAEYWIVDPESESISVNILQNGMYLAEASINRIAQSSVLRGFSVSEHDIFSRPTWMSTLPNETE